MQHKTKILYFINNFSVGGAEKMLLEMVNGLPKDRYEFAVATIMGSGPLEEDFRRAGVKLYLHTKKNKLGIGTLKHCKQVIKDFNPDIVHTHLWSGDTWGRIAALQLRKKFIITTEHNRNENEGVIKKVIKHFLSYFTSIIVASSDAIKDYQVTKELIPAKRIKVIYWGIDLNRFPFRGVRVKRYGEPLEIVHVGRLTDQKGQRYLLEAIAQFNERDEDVRLKLVGDGEDREKLEMLVKRLQIADKVTFAGLSNDMPSVWRDADMFVFPSRYEGLGVVLLEAMAVGVPVIASDIPAVNHLVRHKETGLLFESENSDSIVEAVNYALKNPELQEQLIRNARTMVEREYTLQRLLDEYDQLYQMILGNAKNFAIQYDG